MFKFFLPLILFALAGGGCANLTPAQQVAGAEATFTAAVSALSIAESQGLIPAATYHTIVGVEQAANAAFIQVEADVAAGKALDGNEAWAVASAALQQILIYKWSYNGGSGTTRPATNPTGNPVGANDRGNGGQEFRRRISGVACASGGGPPSRHANGYRLG